MILCKNCSPRKECFYYQNGETRTECKFYKQMTEQEYIQTCNHKELTEILFRMIVHGSVIRPDRQYISEWLKQPHTTIKE